jgi:phosphatidylinositol-3-phosphatase
VAAESTRRARSPIGLVSALAAGVAILAMACTAGAAQAAPRLNHVFLIVGENTSFAQIASRHAPYLTGTLKPQAAWLTRYASFKKSSSLGQYIALVSGQFTRCEANNDLPDKCHQRVSNLFEQLTHKGRSWRDWEESMANACSPLDSGAAWAKNIYSAHHNPALYFTGIQGGKYDEAIAPAAACRLNDLATGTTGPNDTSALDAALGSGQVGDFNMIVPNDCEDGHDPCGTRDPVRQFDDFLAREIPKIMSSPAFGTDGLIVITWDEGGDPPNDPGHVLTALIGPGVRPGVYSGAYNHYSLARLLEDGYGLPRLANAKRARAISGVWR